MPQNACLPAKPRESCNTISSTQYFGHAAEVINTSGSNMVLSKRLSLHLTYVEASISELLHFVAVNDPNASL